MACSASDILFAANSFDDNCVRKIVNLGLTFVLAITFSGLALFLSVATAVTITNAASSTTVESATGVVDGLATTSLLSDSWPENS